MVLFGSATGPSGDFRLLPTISQYMNGEVYRCPEGWSPNAAQSAPPASTTNVRQVLEERLLLLEKRIFTLEEILRVKPEVDNPACTRPGPKPSFCPEEGTR